MFICLRPPPLLGFCWGWSSNFAGYESGQIQSVNSCRIWSSTGLNTPVATHSLYILYFEHTNTYPFNHGLINYKDTKAKCHIKKIYCKGTLRQVLICLRPPPLLGFCLGWSSNFAGSEYGQMQSVNSCRIWSSTGLNIFPCSHTL